MPGLLMRTELTGGYIWKPPQINRKSVILGYFSFVPLISYIIQVCMPKFESFGWLEFKMVDIEIFLKICNL